jgi:hypothetical protein
MFLNLLTSILLLIPIIAHTDTITNVIELPRINSPIVIDGIAGMAGNRTASIGNVRWKL